MILLFLQITSFHFYSDPDDPEVRLWHKNWDASVEQNHSSYEEHASAGDGSLNVDVNVDDSLDNKVNPDLMYSTDTGGVENTVTEDLKLDVENISRIVDDAKGNKLSSNVCDEKNNVGVTCRDDNCSNSGHLHKGGTKQTLKQETNSASHDVCVNGKLERDTDKLNKENSEMSKEFDDAEPRKNDSANSSQLENDRNVPENIAKQLLTESESTDAGKSKNNGEILSTGGDENHRVDDETKKCSSAMGDDEKRKKAEPSIMPPELDDDNSVELPDISVCDSLLDNIKVMDVVKLIVLFYLFTLLFCFTNGDDFAITLEKLDTYLMFYNIDF